MLSPIVLFTEMGGNGKIMMCTLNILKKKMPIGCFCMENIFTTDDLTDAVTVFIVCLVFSPCSEPRMFHREQNTESAWSDQKINAVFLKEDPEQEMVITCLLL